MDIPAKRQRMDGENENGKSKAMKSRNIESVFFDLLKFFSVEKNWNRESIERELLPAIFGYSNSFQYGKKRIFRKYKTQTKTKPNFSLEYLKMQKVCK